MPVLRSSASQKSIGLLGEASDRIARLHCSGPFVRLGIVAGWPCECRTWMTLWSFAIALAKRDDDLVERDVRLAGQFGRTLVTLRDVD